MPREVYVHDLEGKPVSKVTLPSLFDTAFRPDLIRRAVVALQTHRIQPKGRDPMAGKRTTAESFGVGRDLARVPRVKGHGYAKAGQAAFAPGTVKGRSAFPPTPEKRIRKKINRKEYRLALLSAVAATASKDIVARRGHVLDRVPEIPLIVSDEIQRLSRAKEARKALEALGIWKDVERVISRIKIRAGKGKMRGRRKKHPVGPLFVVGADEGISRALRNIPGVDVIDPVRVNVEHLAPGTHPGRLTVWSKSALHGLEARFSGEV